MVRGGLLVQGNKNKKEELVKKAHPSQPKMKEGLHVKNHMEGSQCLHHIMNYADASLGEWGSHAFTSSIVHGAQRLSWRLIPTNASQISD
jgi:hypothetical protein